MSDIQAQRAARRAAMPIVSAFVEQYAEFAPTVIYAEEAGIRVGKKPQDAEVFDIPPRYGATAPVRGKR